ncbi:hypothetical protein Dimus_032585 [Dionaea muscipula]
MRRRNSSFPSPTTASYTGFVQQQKMEYSNCNETWEWQGEDNYLQKDSNLGLFDCMWGSSSVIQHEDLSYMFEESTPVKACGDIYYHVSGSENIKVPEGSKETSSQVKRRRMLQFDNEMIIDPPFQCQDISSSLLKSKEKIDSMDDVLLDVSEWECGFQDDLPLCGFEGLDQAESWLADCLNDAEMLGSSEPNSSGTSDSQNDHTEDNSVQSSSRAIMVEPRPIRTSRSIIFKGKKAYLRASGKITSSVAYPFTFIKPCSAHGDVTLKEINQKIHSPPPKPKQHKEDPVESFPTSAFSGKPVVGKTKIRTEGGKGSITITRTKG